MDYVLIQAGHRALIKGLLFFSVFRPFPEIFGEELALLIGSRLVDLSIILVIFTWQLQQNLIRFRELVFVFSPVISFLIIKAIVLTFRGGLIDLEMSSKLLVLPTYVALLLPFNRCKKIRYPQNDIIFKIVILFVLLIILRIFFLDYVDLIYSSGKYKISGSVIRAFPITPNPNWFGAISCVLLFGFLFVRRFERIKRADILLLAVLFTLISLSGSRSSIFVMLMIFIAAFFSNFRVRRLCSLFALCALIVAGGVYVVADIFQLDLFQLPKHQRSLLQLVSEGKLLSSIESFKIRLDLWSMAVEDFLSSPLMGCVYCSVLLSDGQFFGWLGNVGIIGTLLLLFYFGLFVHLCLRDQTLWVKFLLFGILSMLSITSNLLENTFFLTSSVLFFLCISHRRKYSFG